MAKRTKETPDSTTNDMTTAFDKRIDTLQKFSGKPEKIIDAAVEVHDTLELASLAADDIFKEKSSPELILRVYELIEQRRSQLVKAASEDEEAEDKSGD